MMTYKRESFKEKLSLTVDVAMMWMKDDNGMLVRRNFGPGAPPPISNRIELKGLTFGQWDHTWYPLERKWRKYRQVARADQIRVDDHVVYTSAGEPRGWVIDGPWKDMAEDVMDEYLSEYYEAIDREEKAEEAEKAAKLEKAELERQVKKAEVTKIFLEKQKEFVKN